MRKNIQPARSVFIGILCLFIPATLLADIGKERQTELLYLLKHDCGSCHGITRKGGIGSPLLPSALAEKSNDVLVNIILDGIPGTPMPPWRPFMNPKEAQWLVQVLRNKKDNQ